MRELTPATTSELPFVRVAKPLRFPKGDGAGQRRAPRREVEAEALVKEPDIDEEEMPLQFSQVSATGAFISSDLLLPVGQRLDVRFAIPGRAGPVEAQGQIVRVQYRNGRAGMGFVFERMSADDRASLREFTDWAD